MKYYLLLHIIVAEVKSRLRDREGEAQRSLWMKDFASNISYAEWKQNWTLISCSSQVSILRGSQKNIFMLPLNLHIVINTMCTQNQDDIVPLASFVSNMFKLRYSYLHSVWWASPKLYVWFLVVWWAGRLYAYLKETVYKLFSHGNNVDCPWSVALSNIARCPLDIGNLDRLFSILYRECLMVQVVNSIGKIWILQVVHNVQILQINSRRANYGTLTRHIYRPKLSTILFHLLT